MRRAIPSTTRIHLMSLPPLTLISYLVNTKDDSEQVVYIHLAHMAQEEPAVGPVQN